MSEAQDDRPTVFISHDSRDWKLAESFAHLIEDATANVIGSFRSSDRSGKRGIPFGEDWYARVLDGVDRASDVVCLLTPNSYARPWVIFEAGYAMGRHDKRVYGLVVGMDLNRVASGGPFARFNICTDDPKKLAGLISQIASRVEHCNPTERVLEQAIGAFTSVVRRAQRRLHQAFSDRHPRRVHHVSLPVTQLGRSASFYLKDIGLRRVPRPKLNFKIPGAWFELPEGQQLHLIENAAGTYRKTPIIDYNDCHFAVRVPDLSAAYDRLSRTHTTAVNEDITFKRYPHFYVLDPDNHIVEVNADRVSDRTLFRQFYS